MKENMEKVLSDMTQVNAEPEDYIGADGLLYCGKCHTPKQFRMDKPLLNSQIFPAMCRCRKEQMEQEERKEKERKHLEVVRRLKKQGFSDQVMENWTFEHDNGRNPQMQYARAYVEKWPQVKEENLGCLFWGGVGTGKSYLAGCIANALMEKEVPVFMTNFPWILNSLVSSFEGRNELVKKLCQYSLLIVDDFGIERGTEYGLEQIYNVIDSRYRSGKPLIITTNLNLSVFRNPADLAHARIYDRVLEMCVPIRMSGENFRKSKMQDKMDLLRELMG